MALKPNQVTEIVIVHGKEGNTKTKKIVTVTNGSEIAQARVSSTVKASTNRCFAKSFERTNMRVARPKNFNFPTYGVLKSINDRNKWGLFYQPYFLIFFKVLEENNRVLSSPRELEE